MIPPTPSGHQSFGPPRSFPYYTNLTDRQFEELLYSLFLKHLTTGQQPYCNVFDAAYLPSGVSDRGQDVILTKAGRRVGLIQCKHYEDALNKPDCAKEIIKFALYAICDPRLITDRNEFTYYFATTSKFSNPAVDLIASFNIQIEQEPDLKVWTMQILQDRNYRASFSHLTYPQIEVELRDILVRINVETIIPTQLDGWLSQPGYELIVQQFFPHFLFVVPANPTQLLRTDAELLSEFFLASTDLLSRE